MDSETMAEMCKAHEFILKARPDAVDVAVPVADMTALLTAAKLSEARARVCEAAKRVQEITYRRDRDEMENAAAGMTFSIGVLADARQELDTALAALAAAEEEPI